MKYIVNCNHCMYWYEAINEKAMMKIAHRHSSNTGHTASTEIRSETTKGWMPDA